MDGGRKDEAGGIPHEKGEDEKSNNPNLKRGGGHKEPKESGSGPADVAGDNVKGGKKPSLIFAPNSGKGKNEAGTSSRNMTNSANKGGQASGDAGKGYPRGMPRDRGAAVMALMEQPPPPTTPPPDKGKDWYDGYAAGFEAAKKWKEGFMEGCKAGAMWGSDILLVFVSLLDFDISAVGVPGPELGPPPGALDHGPCIVTMSMSHEPLLVH